ncbi:MULTISPECIES: hypothetical protein [unclassified Nocardioides]|uniref:hypothetical protein n=1 Tax=unclassified Nocardioides TaxID=2615069 RepID=UPI0012E3A6EB|nr:MULTISPECIES: hypothetical protein [unclassified Nocardioides]
MPGTGMTYSWSVDDGLQGWANWSTEMGGPTYLNIGTAGDYLERTMDVELSPPAGEILRAGVTFPVIVGRGKPPAGSGRVSPLREGTVCGTGRDQMAADARQSEVAIGTVHIIELVSDEHAVLTRFAATYELSCQALGGQAGLEGSIAFNATAPLAALPDEPAAPGPITELAVANVGPQNGDQTTTTLTWQNPSGFGDVVIDMVQSEHPEKLPALVGTDFYGMYRGRANRYVARAVETGDTRVYRVVARGSSGRLGPPTFVTVQGSRLDIKDWLSQKVTLGEPIEFSGRLRLAWDYVDPRDAMKGPGLAGRLLILCSQSSVHYVDQDCSPVDRVRTGRDGRFSLSTTPVENSLYKIVVPATDRMVGNVSQVTANALVAPVTDLTAPESESVAPSPSARTSARASVRRGSVVHFSTVRAPAGSRGVVLLQRYDGNAWRTVLTKHFDTRRTGARRLAIPYREWRGGRHAYRVVKLADKRHINGHSRTVQVRVR